MAKHRKEPGIWLAIVLALGIVGSALLIWFVFTYVPATDADSLTGSSTTSVDPPAPTTLVDPTPQRTIQSEPSRSVPRSTKGSRPSPSPTVDQDPRDSEGQSTSGY